MAKSKKKNAPKRKAVQSSTPKIKIQLNEPARPVEKEEPPPPKEVAQPETSPTPDAPATPDQPRPRPPSARTQCFRCQHWGHKSYTCSGETRCVKCGQAHRASECPKRSDEPPTCANCGGAHPASYRGCPAAPKSKRRRRKPKPRQDLQIPGVKKEEVSRLVKVVCKLLTRKDFFTEAQLAIIAKDLDDLPATKDASTQFPDEIAISLPSEPTASPIAPAPVPTTETSTASKFRELWNSEDQTTLSTPSMPESGQPSCLDR